MARSDGTLAQRALHAAPVAIRDPRVRQCQQRRRIRHLTGSVGGGINPVGQKHPMVRVIDETCVLFDTIVVRRERRGLDVEVAPADAIRVLDAVIGDIVAP
jgi:Cys-tRNA(Pro)/Cys-tRNA(Cys) deacylase